MAFEKAAVGRHRFKRVNMTTRANATGTQQGMQAKVRPNVHHHITRTKLLTNHFFDFKFGLHAQTPQRLVQPQQSALEEHRDATKTVTATENEITESGHGFHIQLGLILSCYPILTGHQKSNPTRRLAKS